MTPLPAALLAMRYAVEQIAALLKERNPATRPTAQLRGQDHLNFLLRKSR